MTDKSRKAVPREPTDEMITAGWQTYYQCPTPRMMGPIWTAMFDAAPVAAPAEPPKDGEVAALIERLRAWIASFPHSAPLRVDLEAAADALARLSAPPAVNEQAIARLERARDDIQRIGESNARLQERLSAPVPDIDVAQDDLREILRAVGLSDCARTYSPHEVVQRELLPHLRTVMQHASMDAAPVPAREHSAIEIAARNLVKVKGRHHSEIAYNALVDAVVADATHPPAADK